MYIYICPSIYICYVYIYYIYVYIYISIMTTYIYIYIYLNMLDKLLALNLLFFLNLDPSSKKN